jgi:hypothetical protein
MDQAMTDKPELIADDAPDWAHPGNQVAVRSGWGGGTEYQIKQVSRHTKTRIWIGTQSYKLGRTGAWKEVGGIKYHEDTLEDPAGERMQTIEREKNRRTARLQARQAAEAFIGQWSWNKVEDAEKLQDAIGKFITTMNAIGEE